MKEHELRLSTFVVICGFQSSPFGCSVLPSLSKGLRPHAAGPLFFRGVVAKRRSGYVSVGHWLGWALGKH